jgi:VIT1/CCC1 family predicted Fe2+/Mn2+ transporter
MKRRFFKTSALFLSGGVLFQLGGCLPILTDVLVQQVFATILSIVVNQLVTQFLPSTT